MKGLKVAIMLILLSAGGLVIWSTTYRDAPSFTIANAGAQTEQASAAAPANDEAKDQPQSDPEKESDRLAKSRDAYLDDAIQDWNSSLKAAVCARKLYYSNKAREWARQTGGDIERWYLDRLVAQVSEVSTDPRSFTGYTGDPDQKQIAVSVTTDQLALLLAQQDLYQGRSGKDCSASFATALEKTGKFQNTALTRKAYEAQHQEAIKKLNGATADAGK